MTGARRRSGRSINRRAVGRAPGNGVASYLAKASPEARPMLVELRRLVRSAAPSAVEEIRYGMPYYRYRGRAVVGFAAFSKHVSLFGSLAGFEREFSPFKTRSGTVQFPLGSPLPTDTIRRFVVLRVRRIEATDPGGKG